MILGLASTSGRTFPNQIEDLISEGTELAMEIVPFLSQFPKHYFLEGEAKKEVQAQPAALDHKNKTKKTQIKIHCNFKR